MTRIETMMSPPWRRIPRRTAATITAGLLTIVGLGSLSAGAAPTPSPTDALTTLWDQPTALSLDWRGRARAIIVGDFVGEPISVPGDQTWRTLRIRNDGPCDGNLTIDLDDVKAHVPAGAVNTELPDLINLGWNVDGVRTITTFSTIIAAGGSERIASRPLARTAEIPLTLGYEFPYDETRGRNWGLPSTELTFAVRITLRGDETCVTPSPDDSSLHPSPSGSGPSSSGTAATSPSLAPPPRVSTSGPSSTASGVSIVPPPRSTSVRPVAPPTSPPVSGMATTRPGPGALPETGTIVGSIAVVAAALVLLGLAARRRRRNLS
jgi:LPXTG-motif cell wall-anchored protein